ncbi:cytochrome P450 [Nocardia terpenica]|uniref:Cytochrome P450 n=1 Tax=Nocardia terpenica TaxID=455432 RepID=A0A6G9ZE54_9NOCA|nr:cytochrome P450 [Nocardia terpenica]QIS23627.1 cytochrome P450 [Nocardia terpenica]
MKIDARPPAPTGTRAWVRPPQEMSAVVGRWVDATADVLALDENTLLARHPDQVRTVLTGRDYLTRGQRPAALMRAERALLSAAAGEFMLLDLIAVTHAQQLATRLEHLAAVGDGADLTAMMDRLVVRVLLEALLGPVDVDEIAAAVAAASRVADVPVPPAAARADSYTGVTAAVCAALARQSPLSRGPVVQRLIDDGHRMEVIATHLAILLVDGCDMVAQALSWTWISLISATPVYRQWRQQIQATPALARTLTGDLTRESLRLFPPAWALARTAASDTRLGQTPVAGGTLVVVSPFVTHRHPQIWGEQAQRFAPQRARPAHRFAWLPFGAGHLQCVGAAYALWMADVVVSILGRRVQFHPVTGGDAVLPRFGRVLAAPAFEVEISAKER